MGISLSQPLSVSAGILAGGQGSRLGNRDKGLLQMQGRAFAEILSSRLRPEVDQVLISANRNTGQYAQWADRVVRDVIADCKGPLRGIDSLLQACSSACLLLTPCDTPALPADYVSRFRRLAERDPQRAVVAHDGERVHPLHLWLPCHDGLGANLSQRLAADQLRVMDWIRSLSPLTCDFSDCPEAFRNINTEAAYQKLLDD